MTMADTLTRLQRIYRILSNGGTVDGARGARALSDAFDKIQALQTRLDVAEELAAQYAADRDALRAKLADARSSCAATVFMTRIEAGQEDADDLGVSGWLPEAEDRIRRGV